jgi:carbohydrate esterase-like sialic acid-specific acetylesterase
MTAYSVASGTAFAAASGSGSNSSGGFSIRSLFAGGVQGAWYDNQDLSTLFSDAAMTTPAVVDGPVGGQRDKSGNNWHRTQATAGTRPTLRRRADGVYYLDYTGSKVLSVPASTAAFKYLHDGTGCTFIAWLEWAQGTASSNYLQTSAATTTVGIQVIKSASTENVVYSINRGTSGILAATQTIDRAALSSGLRMLTYTYKNDGTASDIKSYLDNGLTMASSATANAPSSADAAQNLQTATSFSSFEYGLILRQGVISSQQMADVYAKFRVIDYPVPVVDLTLILGGQSNMSGRGTVVTTPAEDKLVGAYSYTKAEEFRIATIPEHSIVNRPVATSPDESTLTTPQHGFALRTAKKLKTDSAKNVLLVPCAIGSTSMSQWAKPATKRDRTSLFGAMDYRYSVAAAKAGTPVFVWYGHEANAGSVTGDFTNGGINTTYQTAWNTLVSELRTEIANAPIIFCQLASDDTLADAERQAQAGEAQRQLELSVANSFMVVTHDVQRNASTDDIHVSREGFDVVADRVALAIREHILGEPVNGTGPRIVAATKSGAVVTLTCNKAINASATNYGTLFRVYAGGVEQTVTSAVRNADTTKIDITCSIPLVGSVTLTYGFRAGPASAARTDFVMDSDSLPLPLFGPILAT